MPSLIGLALSTTASAAENEHRHHKAHKHAEVLMNLIQSDSSVMIEIEAPADDVVGFEHQPKNKKQQKLIDDAVAVLNDASRIISFNPEAQCLVKEASIKHGFNDGHDEHHDHDKHDHDKHDHDKHDHDKHDHDKHDHDKHDHDKHDHDKHDHDKHDHDAHHDGEHSDEHSEFIVSYSFECQSPEKLKTLSTEWFSVFTSTREIKLKGITDKGSTTAELTPDNTSVNL
ncbi:hypothetical protein A8L45_11905 [Veronia pacifica]|uniref:Zinc-binding protein n=1 Tax=Veronia pacifica TaxID=1080227 RepID=A0A1C3EIL2_9GAMM|nr:hypothetical protein A8L45_11905 [Veronia pacifica]